jgi:hypothetical protein
MFISLFIATLSSLHALVLKYKSLIILSSSRIITQGSELNRSSSYDSAENIAQKIIQSRTPERNDEIPLTEAQNAGKDKEKLSGRVNGNDGTKNKSWIIPTFRRTTGNDNGDGNGRSSSDGGDQSGIRDPRTSISSDIYDGVY